jgi:hypothetical protein
VLRSFFVGVYDEKLWSHMVVVWVKNLDQNGVLKPKKGDVWQLAQRFDV